MNTNHPPRVAIWAAVSSAPQAAPDRSSLDEQLAAGERFAASINGVVVATYVVPGHTRDLIFWSDAEASMPAYRELREGCESGTFDVLFAFDMDRLGRDPALSNQVISLVDKSGAEVYLASAPHVIGQVSTGQRYIHAIQAVRAKEDQTLRKHRQRSGMTGRLRKRGLPASHWPFGYQPVRDPISGNVVGAEPHPVYGPLVTQITERFLRGESYHTIRAWLESSGYRPPKGQRWTVKLLSSTMLNDTYAGLPHYDTITPDEPSSAYPALWDPETHARVILERARRTNGPHRRTGGSPFNGIAICARCGANMVRITRRTGPTLRCSTHVNPLTPGACHPNTTAESDVADALGDHLQALAQHPPDPAQFAADSMRIRSDLILVHSRLDAIQASRERLALALAAGQMEPAIYRTTDDSLLMQAETLTAERQRLESLAGSMPTVEAIQQALDILVSTQLSALIAVSVPAHVRSLLEMLNVRVYVEGGRIVRIEPGVAG